MLIPELLQGKYIFIHECQHFSIKSNKALWGLAVEFGIHLHSWLTIGAGLNGSSRVGKLHLAGRTNKSCSDLWRGRTGPKLCQFSLFSFSATVLSLELSPGLYWWKIPLYENEIMLSLNIWNLVMIRDKTFLYSSNELDQDKWVKAIRRSFSSSQSFLKMEW